MRRWVLPIAFLAIVGCKKHKEEIVAGADGGRGPGAGAFGGSRDAGATAVESSAGSGEHPSEGECRAAFKNGTALMMAKQMEGAGALERGRMKMMMKDHLAQMEEKSVAACVKTAPREEVECTIRAKTLNDVAHCQGQELSDAGVAPTGPVATEKDCNGLSKFIGHILDTDPAVKAIPPDQLKALRDSLSDMDKRCPGMPLDILHCMQKATALSQLVVCANPNGQGPPPGP